MNGEGQAAGSIYDSFNARNLSPLQVAKTFIPPKQFDELLSRQHSVVVGPRGSGKTTLLKMLQLPALAEWQHPEADGLRKKIDFTAAFIASDVSWSEQLNHFDGAILSTQLKHVLGRAAFTTHVLSAIVDSFRDCSSDAIRRVTTLEHQFVSVSREQERDIAVELSKSWKIDAELLTFSALKIALVQRLSEILAIAKKESLSDETEAKKNLQDVDYLHLDTIATVGAATTAFRVIANCEQKKWALLFDELEIAPRDIQRTLFKNLRSGGHDILYKLSVSPFDKSFKSFDSAKSPTQRNDYQKIELWYPHKESAYAFSEALVSSMIKEALPNGQRTPSELFGESEFDAPLGPERNQTYLPGGKAYLRFKDLAARDPSFARYLTKHAIDLESLDRLDENNRAETIRRVTSIVVVRETFRGSPRGGPNTPVLPRSRKNPDIYAGARSLFAIAEGNPRWLIGLFTPLIREAAQGKDTVSRARQSQEISAAAHTFSALLATFPYKAQNKNVGLLELLNRIGRSFYLGVVIDDFSAQPPLSFVVDRRCDDELVSALGLALNAGAIVYVPEKDGELVLITLRGKRFRLSYMLSAVYKIPLLLGLDANLSGLLQKREPDPDLMSYWEFRDG